MLHLIAYDIANPKRLRRVAKICEDYGIRVERSVFECDLSDTDMAAFWTRLCQTVDTREDCVVSYRIGAIDRRHIRRLGGVGETLSADDIVII